MGKGINAAKALAPEHAALIDDMKEQLLLALVKRLGGQVTMPIAEIDATGGYDLLMSLRGQEFHFALRPKA